MSAVLITTELLEARPHQTLQLAHRSIVFGGGSEDSVKWYGECLDQQKRSAEFPSRVVGMSAIPVFEHLFTETARVPLDWRQVAGQTILEADAQGELDAGAGYWVTFSKSQAPEPPPRLDALRARLPAQLESALNWEPAKLFYFLFCVLDESADEPQFAIVAQGRNSVAAAWAWRTFAPEAPVARNPIALQPWCPIVEFGKWGA